MQISISHGQIMSKEGEVFKRHVKIPKALFSIEEDPTRQDVVLSPLQS